MPEKTSMENPSRDWEKSGATFTIQDNAKEINGAEGDGRLGYIKEATLESEVK